MLQRLSSAMGKLKPGKKIFKGDLFTWSHFLCGSN